MSGDHAGESSQELSWYRGFCQYWPYLYRVPLQASPLQYITYPILNALLAYALWNF
ncbi:hypothetical protein BS47DRAFT_1354889 [Hydnum rufescens UP504]|uniref:Uncharacterized protein n=1 Tax=Hydnum rufescens UP504 TaxID=1448309 RepID=A0A9P6AGT3_9AGAM|nr:hypothetical protein BS47DRAFT_1354889 [Hydnum rufescens UP504]